MLTCLTGILTLFSNCALKRNKIQKENSTLLNHSRDKAWVFLLVLLKMVPNLKTAHCIFLKMLGMFNNAGFPISISGHVQNNHPPTKDTYPTLNICMSIPAITNLAPYFPLKPNSTSTSLKILIGLLLKITFMCVLTNLHKFSFIVFEIVLPCFYLMLMSVVPSFKSTTRLGL